MSVVAVVGGGLAGAAAAMLLARGGVNVVLLEQHAEARHKVCGEFLSTEACESLAVLGLEVQGLGAIPVEWVRMAGRSRMAERRLPFRAWSLTRRTLDEAMLRMAAESGVEVRRGIRVEGVERAGKAWRLQTSTGTELLAGDVFCANGKHDLRGHARPDGLQRGLIAFKQYFRLRPIQQAELAQAIELVLFRGGYAGLQMVEGGWANLCLLVEARRYRQLGGRWELLLETMVAESGHLRWRLEGAEAQMERPLALSRIPYGYLRDDAQAQGLWWMGDQAAVIPSFSGDGMSIALHSARVAAEIYLRGGGAAEMTSRLQRELRGQMWRATAISRLMVSGVGQRVVVGAVRWMPSLLARGAAVTRVRTEARLRLLRG